MTASEKKLFEYILDIIDFKLYHLHYRKEDIGFWLQSSFFLISDGASEEFLNEFDKLINYYLPVEN